MSVTEIRMCRAECLEKDADHNALVLHKVDFEIKESGDDWKPHSITLMATDPMDAINAVRKEIA